MKALFIGSCTACFELENGKPYFAPAKYRLFLNGEALGEKQTNVFSLFDLKPGTDYDLTCDYEESPKKECLSFRTGTEACALSVLDFGAKGDGTTDDTAAIQAAIAFLPPGGRLVFPAGTYLTGPLALKSHISLEIKKDATLLAKPNKEAYPVLPGELADLNTGESVHFGAYEGIARPMYQAFLTAEYAEDIRILGEGTLDGNGSLFWQSFKEDPIARPRLCFFNRCRGITLHGLRAQNSASWNFHPYFSEDVSFLDLKIRAPKDSPNTDAIDPESCDGVNIIGCDFSVGDDCVAIKSGKIELGRKYKKAASRHVIRNCRMRYGHGAVTLGSEMAAGVRELSVSRSLFIETDRGLRIKTRRGRGKDAIIDGVTFENIEMKGVKTPIVMNMWYNCCDPDRFSEYVWSRDALPVDERTPRLGSFLFRDMVCEDCEAAACYIDGLPEQPIESVTLENIRFRFADDAEPYVPAMQNFAEKRCRLGLYFDNVTEVALKNVTVEGAEGDAVIARHVGKLRREETE